MHLIQHRARTTLRSSRSASLRARLLSAEKTVNYPQSTTLIFSRRFNQFEVEILHRSPSSLSASRLLGRSLFGCSSVTAPLFPLYNIYGGLSRHRYLTQRSPPCLLDIQPTFATNAFCPNTASPCKSCCLLTDVQVNLTQGTWHCTATAKHVPPDHGAASAQGQR